MTRRVSGGWGNERRQYGVGAINHPERFRARASAYNMYPEAAAVSGSDVRKPFGQLK